MHQNKKIVFVGNSLLHMIKFRGHTMTHLAQLGYEVHLIAAQDISFKEKNLPPMISLHKWLLKPTNHNPFWEILSFFHLLKLLMRLNPHISFSYTVKANLYCAIIGKIGGFKTCSVITGLGRIFTLRRPLYGRVKRFILWGWQLSTRVWVMNQFDYRYLRFIDPKLRLDQIPGEGVDTTYFTPSHKECEHQSIHFLFIGRLLKAKGLGELFQAVENLWHKGYPLHLKIAGSYDLNDKDKINKEHLDRLVSQGVVEYCGYREDVRSLIQGSHCLVLPSYREGLPCVLLEANAMQCPVITTKVPGCQDIVKEGINGFLCAPRCVDSLEKALQKFMDLSEKESKKMGIEGQKMIYQKFTLTHVQDFYRKVLHSLDETHGKRI